MLGMYIALLETEEQKNKFEAIYRKYSGFMYHVAMDTVHDHYLAEDVVHETFLNLIRIIDDIRVSNERELMNFLKILTYHQAVNLIRKNSKTKKYEDILADDTDVVDDTDLENIVLSKIGFEKMLQAVSSMGEKYKSPLLLRVQGYKVSEIATFLNITPSNVKVRLHRARKLLLCELEEHDG